MKKVILDCIAKNPKITYNELAEKMELGRRTVQRHIQILKDEGRLRRIGAERSGHWEVVDKGVTSQSKCNSTAGCDI
jgi:ATP-dependent DNA helicase RecG